jgi:hypothetical protein
MNNRKFSWDNDEFYIKNQCFCGGGGSGGGTPPPSSSSPEYGGEFMFEEPGPSESELALVEIATEKYDRFKKQYDPVEATWLREQDQDYSDYGAMMGYADAQQVSAAPNQINAASGAAAAGLAGLASAGTGGAAAAKSSAMSQDFQRRNANKLWGLSTANKLQSANQGTLASVAASASSAATSVASSAQGYQNRLVAAQNQMAHESQVMKYNYNQGRVQNLAQMGASLIGHYQGANVNQLGGGGFGFGGGGGYTNPFSSNAGTSGGLGIFA